MMKDKKVEDDTKADMKEKKELRTFSKSIGLCLSPDSKELLELEEIFALGIAQVLQFVVRETDEEVCHAHAHPATGLQRCPKMSVQRVCPDI